MRDVFIAHMAAASATTQKSVKKGKKAPPATQDTVKKEKTTSPATQETAKPTVKLLTIPSKSS